MWDYIGAYYKGSLKTLKHRFQAALGMVYFWPEQAFRRLPRAGASPCTPHRSPAIRCSI
ncbi:MAG: hypothetical protein ACFNS8_01135 [Kingella oralis]